jgi:signal transduction histidine kinase
MATAKNDPLGGGDGVEEALRLLRVGTATERLGAARLLLGEATATETPALEAIRRRELDRYVQQAVDEAIRASRDRPPRVPPQQDSYDDSLDELPWDDATYSQALRAATTSLGHELRRPLGLARLAADRGDLGSVNNYLDRMARLLNAMELLVRLTDPGEPSEFDLADLLRKLAAEHRERFDLPIDVLADSALTIKQHRDSVELIVCNAMTNACESTLAVGAEQAGAILVTCGVTDREIWIGILDHGVGLPAGFEPFTFAATRKEGHDGVGLALARRAALSIGAEITLTQREDGGATFRLTCSANLP